MNKDVFVTLRVPKELDDHIHQALAEFDAPTRSAGLRALLVLGLATLRGKVIPVLTTRDTEVLLQNLPAVFRSVEFRSVKRSVKGGALKGK